MIPLGSDSNTNKLYQGIVKELSRLFGHSPNQASALFQEFYQDHSEYDEDWYFHESDWGVAVRIQYEKVLGKDTTQLDFLYWRKDYD